LAAGKVHADGPSEQVIRSYQQSFGSVGIGTQIGRQSEGPVQLNSVRLLTPDGSALEHLRRGEPFAIEIGVTTRDTVMGLDAAIYVEDSRGVRVLDEALSEALAPEADLSTPGGYRLAWTCRLRFRRRNIPSECGSAQGRRTSSTSPSCGSRSSPPWRIVGQRR